MMTSDIVVKQATLVSRMTFFRRSVGDSCGDWLVGSPVDSGKQILGAASGFKSLYLKRPYTAHRNGRSLLVGASDTALRLINTDFSMMKPASTLAPGGPFGFLTFRIPGRMYFRVSAESQKQ